MYTRRKVFLGLSSSSASAAGTHSTPQYVGDYARMTLSRISSTGSASNLTVQGTNFDGFTAAIPEGQWSTITIIPNQGLFTVDPGFAWMRAIRPVIGVSATSNETVTLFGATSQ